LAFCALLFSVAAKTAEKRGFSAFQMAVFQPFSRKFQKGFDGIGDPI
jgi:hypothetical protein